MDSSGVKDLQEKLTRCDRDLRDAYREGKAIPADRDPPQAGIPSKVEEKLKAARRMRVVVSMTTTPCKLYTKVLWEAFQRVKEQTFPPDAIYLTVALKGGRDGLPYILPPWVTEDKDITVLVTAEDLGPVMKMLPVMVRETDPDTRIVTMDDDARYPPNMIQHLVEWSLHYPGAALSWGNGLNLTCVFPHIFNCSLPVHGRMHYFVMTQQDYDHACTSGWTKEYGMDMCAAYPTTDALPVHIIQGVGGCMYVRGSFKQEFFKLLPDWRKHACFYNDDFYAGGHLAMKGVPRLVVPNKVLPPNPVFENNSIGQRRVPFHNQAFTVPWSKTGGDLALPFNGTLCAGDLHGLPDRMFKVWSTQCALHFIDHWEDTRLEPEFYQKPDYFLPLTALPKTG